jgi:hypothetical protein
MQKPSNGDLKIQNKLNANSKSIFEAINNPCQWWSGNITGTTDELGQEWVYRYQNIHYSKQKVVEMIQNKKVAWEVTDSYISFVENKAEWNGSRIAFEIEKNNGGTVLTFTHLGLMPTVACYEDCKHAWEFYIKESLRNSIVSQQEEWN